MMFREKSISKLYAFALAAVFALTLAGCGGSGGGSAMEEEMMPPVVVEPTAQETCEGDGGRYNEDGSCTSAEDVAAEMAAAAAAAAEATALSGAQEAAMAAYTAAMAAVYAAVDPVARANAHMYAAMAGTANEAAMAAMTSEMAMTYQTAAETARDMAMEAGMARSLGITKTANANANQSTIDSATLIGVPPPSPVSNAGRVGAALAAAAGGTAAINQVGDDATATPADIVAEITNQVAAAATNDADEVVGTSAEVTVTASHNGSAPRFTVSAALPNPTSTTPNAATVLERGEIPTALMMRGEKPGGGWPGAELVDTAPGIAGKKEYAVVYTDINPPAQSYEVQSAEAGATDNAKHYTIVELGGDPTDANDLGYVNKGIVTGDIPGDGGHFEGTFNPNPTDNTPPYGGRFFCPSGTPCSISVDSSGVLKAITGYTFQRSIPGTVMRGDSDYLAWGVWLHVPNEGPGVGADGPAAPATAAAFAGGNALFEVDYRLTGTATYNGVANGLYSAAGMVEYFDADASLTADFGGRTLTNDSTPATVDNDMGLLGAVTGTISNIKAGGMDVDGSLTLGRAPLIAGDDPATIEASVENTITPADPATSFTGSTAGILGGNAMSGSWGGQFYGKPKAPAGSVAVRTEYPTTAAGTFGATSILPGVSILGAFGAWKAE